MTNTLHRFGRSEGLKRDFVVFAIPCRGRNDRDCVPELKEFLRRAVKHNPVNMGDASQGSIFRPDKALSPSVHWKRKTNRQYDAVIAGVTGPTTVSAVFDNPEAAAGFIRELREADLGLSVNLSALIEDARRCCERAGLERHSVEYALRPMGNIDRLAEAEVLDLSTMCGHGMISFNLARKMVDLVREGRRSPEQAAECLCRLCTCGVFNPRRAVDILDAVGRAEK